MQPSSQSPHDVSYLEYKGKYKGLLSWILSTDHKRIALALHVFHDDIISNWSDIRPSDET